VEVRHAGSCNVGFQKERPGNERSLRAAKWLSCIKRSQKSKPFFNVRLCSSDEQFRRAALLPTLQIGNLRRVIFRVVRHDGCSSPAAGDCAAFKPSHCCVTWLGLELRLLLPALNWTAVEMPTTTTTIIHISGVIRTPCCVSYRDDLWRQHMFVCWNEMTGWCGICPSVSSTVVILCVTMLFTH
jgi:hypothetical protein